MWSLEFQVEQSLRPEFRFEQQSADFLRLNPEPRTLNPSVPVSAGSEIARQQAREA